MKLTKAAGHQYKRLKYVATMGLALGQLLKDPALIDNCQLLETNASWGYRLSKMKVWYSVLIYYVHENVRIWVVNIILLR